MPTKKIQKDEWKKYFDRFSVDLQDQKAKSIEIQVISEKFGLKPETTGSTLRGIDYDPQTGEIGVYIDKMQHMINNPQEIYVREVNEGAPVGIQVVQENGAQNIINIQ